MATPFLSSIRSWSQDKLSPRAASPTLEVDVDKAKSALHPKLNRILRHDATSTSPPPSRVHPAEHFGRNPNDNPNPSANPNTGSTGGDVSPVASKLYGLRRRSRASSAQSLSSKKKATMDAAEEAGLNARGEGVRLALSFLEAQDPKVLHCAGEGIGWLLHDCGVSSLYTENDESKARMCTSDEVKALSVLAMSRNVSLRQVAGNVIREIASKDGIARGSSTTAEVLKKATQMIHSDVRPLQVFAMRLATQLALKGPIWCERLVQHGWLDRIIEVITSIFTEEESQIVGLASIKEESRMFLERMDSSSHSSSDPNDEERKDGYTDSLYGESAATSAFHSVGAGGGSGSKIQRLNIRGEKKRVLKLALKLIGSLNLVELEQSLKRRPKSVALGEEITNKRQELFRILSKMCAKSSSVGDTSLVILLCGAMSSFLCDLGESDWTEAFAQQFVRVSLQSLLDRAHEAASEIHRINAMLSRMIPTDEASVEREEQQGYRSFKSSASSMAMNRELKTNEFIKKVMHLTNLTCEAMRVLRAACKSTLVACETAERFGEHVVMRILTVLYRSQFPGTKTEVAMFLHALCANVTDRHKVILCENGVIVRLLRLASPSAVYGAYDTPHSADEAAFIPAILALTELGKTDIIGARIILSGGLGPLYSHANSNRKTRKYAREALETLGVTDLNEVLGIWTNYRRQKDLEDHHEAAQHGGGAIAQGGVLDEAAGRRIIRRLNVAVSNDKKEKASKEENEAPHPFMRSMSYDLANVRMLRSQALVAKMTRFDGQQILIDFDQLKPPPPYKSKDIWNRSLVLGTGAFSSVYRSMVRSHVVAERGRNGGGKGTSSGSISITGSGMLYDTEWMPVAVKKYNETGLKDEGFLSEIKVLSKVPPQKNIIAFYGACVLDKSVLVVTELGGPHTLAWHLSNMRKTDDLSVVSEAVSTIFESWKSRVQVLIEISDALKHLQSLSPPILHLDLKSSNILLTEEVDGSITPKLCDFGLAVELRAGHEFLSPANSGTLQWMAPEVMHNEDVELSRGFDQSADVFSFAILMWELAHPGRVPWDELSLDTQLETYEMRIRDMVCSGRRLTCYNTDQWPRRYEALMRQCWRQKPAERPSFVRSFLSDPDYIRWSSDKTGGDTGECIPVELKRILAFCKPMPEELETLKVKSNVKHAQGFNNTRKERRRSSRPANTISDSLYKLTSSLKTGNRRRRGASID